MIFAKTCVFLGKYRDFQKCSKMQRCKMQHCQNGMGPSCGGDGSLRPRPAKKT